MTARPIRLASMPSGWLSRAAALLLLAVGARRISIMEKNSACGMCGCGIANCAIRIRAGTGHFCEAAIPPARRCSGTRRLTRDLRQARPGSRYLRMRNRSMWPMRTKDRASDSHTFSLASIGGMGAILLSTDPYSTGRPFDSARIHLAPDEGILVRLDPLIRNKRLLPRRSVRVFTTRGIVIE